MPSSSPRNASLRRQRREVKTAGTGVLVSVVELPPPKALRADRDDPDARKWLPLRRAGASVPETGPALVVTELHPFDGVGHVRILVLLLLHWILERTHNATSTRRGWARVRGQFRQPSFAPPLGRGKVRNPL